MTRKSKIFLICFCAFTAFCFFLFGRIKYKENILVMVPSSISRQVKLFQNSPLSKKFFIVIEVSNPSDLGAAVKTAQSSLQNIGGIKPSEAAGRDFLLSFYYHLPLIWTESLQAEAEALLTPEVIEEKMQDNIMALMGPQGRFMQDFITADPLGLLSVAGKRLEALNITGGALNFSNGFLSSKDGLKALLLYDTTEDTFDRAGALNIIKRVEALNGVLPEGARAFSMGAARYTQENNDIVAKDVKKVLLISLLAMLAIFLVLFREKNALFIYAVPILVLIPAAVFTYFGLGAISGITLGFGSVLMGLAIDYSVYMYYAFKASSKETGAKAVIKAIAHPVMLSALTSIISFIVIYFCAIPLFEQISVFAVSGLIYAVFIAFFVAPLLYKLQNNPVKDLKLPTGINPAVSVALILCIIAGGFISVKFLRLDTSLDSLNTVTKQFEADRRIFDDITGHAAEAGSLLFVFGRDKDEALGQSLILSRKTEGGLALSELLFPREEQLKNIERWRGFWTAAKIKQIQKLIKETTEPFGIKQEAFAGFYAFLKTAHKPEGVQNFDLTRIYNPFTEFEGQKAVVHVVPGAFELPGEFRGEAVLISQNLISRDLFHKVAAALAFIILIIFIVDFILLIFTFKNIKLALLCFMPVLCAISMVFILSAVFGIRVNLFSLFAIPLIIGVSVDYAIFIIHKHTLSETLYPSIAVASSALLSLAGFGALIFATHKVLFAIGLTITVAIITASLISIYLLPGILKKILKAAPLLLLFFFTACAAPGPKINYAAQAAAAQQSVEVKQYYGELAGRMLFSAAAAGEGGAVVRVVTLNEFGIKLADMTVTKEEVTVHFKINFFPKMAANALAKFYRDFYFDKNSLIKEDLGDGKISYNNKSKKIVLWVENEQNN